MLWARLPHHFFIVASLRDPALADRFAFVYTG